MDLINLDIVGAIDPIESPKHPPLSLFLAHTQTHEICPNPLLYMCVSCGIMCLTLILIWNLWDNERWNKQFFRAGFFLSVFVLFPVKLKLDFLSVSSWTR